MRRVGLEVGREAGERRAQETSRTVRVVAGAAARQLAHPAAKALQLARLGPAEADPLARRGDRPEAEEAGSALR
jgi:hypothetical protein